MRSATQSSFSINQTVELFVEKLTFGGTGLARKDGAVFFIKNAAPSDTLEAKIVEVHKNFYNCEIIEILKPSPYRIEPKCIFAKNCGGCDWQHIKYEEQLKQKENIVKEQLQKTKCEFSLLPIIPSPNEFRYRNRVQLHYEDGAFGFRKQKTHTLVNINDCLITEDLITDKFKELIPTTGNGRVELSLDKNLKVNSRISNSSEMFSNFSQVNRFQNENLINTVLTYMENDSPKVIYDFYAGNGNFTFPISKKFIESQVIGVELSTHSTQEALACIASTKSKNIKFLCSDVSSYLRRTKLEENSIVLVDPPRGGCDLEVLKYLVQAKIKKLYYISCNPSALTRDLTQLNELTKKKMRIGRVQIFDMFPQTHHIETLCEVYIDSLAST